MKTRAKKPKTKYCHVEHRYTMEFGEPTDIALYPDTLSGEWTEDGVLVFHIGSVLCEKLDSKGCRKPPSKKNGLETRSVLISVYRDGHERPEE